MGYASLIPGGIQALGGIISTIMGYKETKEAKKANEDRYKDGLKLNTQTKADTKLANRQLYSQTSRDYDDILSSLGIGYDGMTAQTKDDISNARLAANGRYDSEASKIRNEYGQERNKLWKNFDDLFGQTNKLHSDRQSEGMSLLDGLGTQEKVDLSQVWKNQASKGAQDMVSRGLTGTTIMPTMNAGYERDKNADLSRLNERIQGQKFDAFSTLSGDRLNALSDVRSKQVAGDAGWGEKLVNALGQVEGNRTSTGNALDADLISALSSLRQGRLDQTTAAKTDRLNALGNLLQTRKADNANLDAQRLGWIGDREDIYPDMSIGANMMNQGFSNIGQVLAPKPEKPKSTLGSDLIGLGGSLGSAMIMA